jgi:hypothetical protein
VCGLCSAGKRPTAGALGYPKFVCWCFANGTKLPHITQQRPLKDFGRPTAAKTAGRDIALEGFILETRLGKKKNEEAGYY